MVILITGGAGFVGSNLAMAFKLSHKDERIICLDNLRRRGSELNVPRLREAGIEFVHGDIRNKEDLEPLDRVDTVIECSAEPSVLAGYNSPPDYLINTNLVGTVNCLELARKSGADFIFLSTSRVYPVKTINNLNFVETATRFELSDEQTISGVSKSGFTEQLPLDGTRTLYGTTKLCSELIIQEYVEMYGLKAVTNRCGLLTGSWQMGKVDQGVVVLWVASHYYGRSLSYIGYSGSGKQVRDILHVNDLYRLLEFELDQIGRLSGETFNVGGGREISLSLQELTELCRKHTGREVPVASVSQERPGDIRIYLTDHSKVTRMTGWKPEIGIDEIIGEIAGWIRDNSETLRPILA